MFYSTDLLTLRGGKFNLIWLLSTANDKNAILRKRKKDLLSLDVGNVAQELVKMFPVQGKKVSLSLRTSSLLMHGVFVSFRMKAELLRMDVMKLLSPKSGTNAGGTDDGIDMDARHLSFQQVSLQVEDVDFGFLHEEREVVDFPNLQEEEISSRRKACTMIEVDPPRMTEDDPLPRMTDQQILEAENILTEEVNDPAPTAGHLVTFEEPQIPDDVIAPPVKPKNGSNPKIDVTSAPDVQDLERTPRRFSVAPMDLDQQTNDADEAGIQIAPSVPPSVAVLPPDEAIIQPPDMEENNIPSPPIANGSGSLELGSLSPPDERPRKKRKLGCVWIDVETQISSQVLRSNQDDYGDTMRCHSSTEDQAVARSQKSKQTSGKRLGVSLYGLFRDAMKEAKDSSEGRFDREEDPSAAPAQIRLNDDDLSGIREQSIGIPEAGVSHSESNFNPDSVLHSTAVGEHPEGLLNKEALGNIAEEDQQLPVPVFEHQVTPPPPPVNITDQAALPHQDHTGQIQSTPGRAIDQPEEGLHPPSPPKNLEESINYEEFSRGLQLLEERSDEGFNETMESRTTVDHMRNVFGEHMKGRFQDLVSRETNRTQVAKMFFQSLVANKKEDVILTQDECFGDINVEVI